MLKDPRHFSLPSILCIGSRGIAEGGGVDCGARRSGHWSGGERISDIFDGCHRLLSQASSLGGTCYTHTLAVD